MVDSLDLSFWHTYKPAMYPLTFTPHSQDLSFPQARLLDSPASLLDLASQAVIRGLVVTPPRPLTSDTRLADTVHGVTQAMGDEASGGFEHLSTTSSAADEEEGIEKLESWSPLPNASVESDFVAELMSDSLVDTNTAAHVRHLSNLSPPAVDSTGASMHEVHRPSIPTPASKPPTASKETSESPTVSREASEPLPASRGASEPHGGALPQYASMEEWRLPVELCHALLRAALALFRDDAVERILSTWPSERLVLAHYVDAMFDSVNPLYSDLDLCMEMRRGVKYTTCLAHAFMVCLKRKDRTRLRVLDLTGFPTAEITVSYLASHVLLVSNEERQRSIINTYMRLTQDLTRGGQLRDSCPSTFPDSQFVVYLDALLTSESAHLELCRALHACAHNPSPLRLHIRRLDTTALGVVRIIVLMELLQPQFLTAASFQLNQFVNSALVVLGPPMNSFTNLSSLDLSGNGVSLAGGPVCDTAVSLAAMLAALVSLRRLSLSRNMLAGCLEKLLSGIVHPLTMLRLNACALTRPDLDYLAQSHHAAALEELDFGSTPLRASLDPLRALLRRTTPRLTILELESTDLTVADVVELFSSVGLFHELRYVDVSGGGAPPVVDDVIRVIPYLSAQRHLHAARLTYPSDIAGAACDADLLADVKMAFNVLTKRLIRQLHELDDRAPFRLVFA